MIAHLRVLGRAPLARRMVKNHPEYACALADLIDADSAAKVMNENEADVPALLNILLLTEDRLAKEKAVKVFARHGAFLAKFQKRGLLGLETLFLENADTEADRKYDEWLSAALGGASEYDLGALLLFAFVDGSEIRHRMATETPFCHKFSELWQRLLKVCDDVGQPLELHIGHPKLWDLLLREDGQKLLEMLGPVATELFFGTHWMTDELRNRLAQLTVRGYRNIIEAALMGKFKDHPLFHKLLKAKLPDELLGGAVEQLQSQGDSYYQRLGELAGICDDTDKFREQVRGKEPSSFDWVPFYDTYTVGRKLLAGERITGDEWLGLGLDAADVVLTVGTVGASKAETEVVKQTLKQAVKKQALVQAEKRIGQAMIKTATRKIASETARNSARGGKVAVADVGRWLFSSLLEPKNLNLLPKIEHDITGPTKFLYRNLAPGRESFKFATGLEARVFMRKDAHVVLRLDSVVERTALSESEKYLTSKVNELVDPHGEHAKQLQAAWFLANNAPALKKFFDHPPKPNGAQ
ncbi:hypothetical protein FRUB_08394 [Fimbriiglobus ruber]|uniref:Uncharacterized protein n=2 Tax=Fimbriiglobus ruber TaxID=1908690 RepID=A0A225D2M2_9BACT|nr:hypothetical protein FRUB_08394 [Fimbriiglobus ruber]